jgi:hypothetical protein
MTFASGGNVGVGTSVPQFRIDVLGAGVANNTVQSLLQLRSASNAINNSVEILLTAIENGQSRTAIGGVREGITTNASIYMATANTERMRIDTTGNVGIGTSTPAYKLEVNGSFAATTKSFVINHPTKEGMKLRYGSLEGPENGIYVRGRLKDSNTIALPDYWTGLVDEESITVNLTPIGKHQKLSVSNVAVDTITIKNDNILNSVIDCYYIVYAERKDVEKLVVEY